MVLGEKFNTQHSQFKTGLRPFYPPPSRLLIPCVVGQSLEQPECRERKVGQIRNWPGKFRGSVVWQVGGTMRGSRVHHAMRGWPRMQDVETGFPLRSRIAQRLNVPKSVRLAPSLAAALQEDQFEHPGKTSKLGRIYQGQGSLNGRSGARTGAVPEEGKEESLEGPLWMGPCRMPLRPSLLSDGWGRYDN